MKIGVDIGPIQNNNRILSARHTIVVDATHFLSFFQDLLGHLVRAARKPRIRHAGPSKIQRGPSLSHNDLYLQLHKQSPRPKCVCSAADVLLKRYDVFGRHGAIVLVEPLKVLLVFASRCRQTLLLAVRRLFNRNKVHGHQRRIDARTRS